LTIATPRMTRTTPIIAATPGERAPDGLDENRDRRDEERPRVHTRRRPPARERDPAGQGIARR
jgi:hypothetical protein